MKSFPPGPTTPRPLLVYRLFYHTHALLEDCARRYGEHFTLHIPGTRRSVVFHHPDHVKAVFAANPADLHAGSFSTVKLPLVGEHSLFLLDGAEHMRDRKLLLPPLHGDRMTGYGQRIAEITEASLADWPVGQAFPVYERFHSIIFDIMLRVVFGLEEPARLSELRHRLERVLAVAMSPWLLVPMLQRDLGPWSPWGRFVRRVRAVDDLLYAEIRRRRAEPPGTRDDILALLLQARDEQGQGLTDEEVRDELMTMLVAGKETTAAGIAWALRWLLGTPEAHARLVEELTAGDTSPERLNKLPYLDAVVREALRIQPIAPFIGRVVRRPMQIAGLSFEDGDGIVIAPYLTHRRPELYPDPQRFRPERFLERKYAPSEWLPFGGGVRRCVGIALAQFEMKIVLGTVISRAALRLATDRIREVRSSLIIIPSDGLPVVMERRRERALAA